MTRHQLIGADNSLPWHLPEDLALFRRLTLGNTVVMGHRTYRSLGTPLRGRNNIVLSRQPVEIRGVTVCRGFREGLATALDWGRPVFFIGGVDIYRRALPLADQLHISWVKQDFEGDRYFPAVDWTEWQTCSEQDFPDFRYLRLQRRATRGEA